MRKGKSSTFSFPKYSIAACLHCLVISTSFVKNGYSRSLNKNINNGIYTKLHRTNQNLGKRRKERQIQYNKDHNITPKTIIKSVPEQVTTLDESKLKSTHDLATDIIELEYQMKKYSEELDFERAIECRDRIKRLEKEIKFKDGRK